MGHFKLRDSLGLVILQTENVNVQMTERVVRCQHGLNFC